MSNVHQFSTKDDINDEACLWISRIDRGLTDHERHALIQWTRESRLHEEALLEMAALWDDMSVLNELSGLFPFRQKTHSQRVDRARQVGWKVAASMLFAMVLGAVLFTSPFEPSNQLVADHEVVTEELASTSLGQQKNITLSDGSVVHLNTDSAVAIRYSSSQRLITLLQGEAHFDVSHDPERPFIVAAGQNSVTAIGTAFNIELVDDQAFELVVTEGKVLVQDTHAEDADKVELLTGKRSIVDQGVIMFSGEKALVDGVIADKARITRALIDKDLAWQQGMIIFQGEPLSVVLEEIARYTQIEFTLLQAELSDEKVAGYFKVGDIDGLLYALENGFGIKHVKVSETEISLGEDVTE